MRKRQNIDYTKGTKSVRRVSNNEGFGPSRLSAVPGAARQIETAGER
jgi:hypothetical protein